MAETLNLEKINIGSVLGISGRKELIKDLFHQEPRGFNTHYKKGDIIIETTYKIEDGKPFFVMDIPISSKHRSFSSHAQGLKGAGLW